jgi:hypothetical protein
MDMRTTWRLEFGSKRESKYRPLPTTFVREHLRGELRGHQGNLDNAMTDTDMSGSLIDQSAFDGDGLGG